MVANGSKIKTIKYGRYFMDLKLWKLLWDRYGVLLESKTLGDLEKMKQSGLLGNLIKGVRLDEEKSYD